MAKHHHKSKHHGGGGHKHRGGEGNYLGKGILGKTPKAIRPTKRKRVVKQSGRLMNKLYAGAFADLDTQRSQALNVYKKRESDNKYYLDWLNAASSQLMEHQQAADQTLMQSQQQISDSANQAQSMLQQNLVTQAQSTAGNVSKPQSASSFDTSAAEAQGSGMIANERKRTVDTAYSGKEASGQLAASNFAMMAASNIKNQSDLGAALRDISSARNKVQLEKAAKKAEEVARRLDQEISKAQARLGMKQSAAGLAMQKKQFNLSKREERFNESIQSKQLGLDKKEFQVDKNDTKHDNRVATKGRKETHRHNVEGEKHNRHVAHETHRHNVKTEKNDSGGKRDRHTETKQIVARTRRLIHQYPPPKKNRSKYLAWLQDKVATTEGVTNEAKVNKIVRKLVASQNRSHHNRRPDIPQGV